MKCRFFDIKVGDSCDKHSAFKVNISLTLDGQEDKIPSFNEVYYCTTVGVKNRRKNDSTELHCTLEI